MIENQEDLDRFLGGLSPMLELLELVEKMGSHSLPIPTKDLRGLLDTLRTVAEKQASSSAELGRLRRWKEEATEVLAGWDRVADRVGAEQLGVAKSQLVLERITELEAALREVDELTRADVLHHEDRCLDISDLARRTLGLDNWEAGE